MIAHPGDQARAGSGLRGAGCAGEAAGNVVGPGIGQRVFVEDGGPLEVEMGFSLLRRVKGGVAETVASPEHAEAAGGRHEGDEQGCANDSAARAEPAGCAAELHDERGGLGPTK